VRELQNVIEYSFVCCGEKRIRREHLPTEIRGSVPGGGPVTDADGPLPGSPLPEGRERIIDLLGRHRGNRSEVARLLGISRTTLWRRMKQHDISERS